MCFSRSSSASRSSAQSQTAVMRVGQWMSFGSWRDLELLASRALRTEKVMTIASMHGARVGRMSHSPACARAPSGATRCWSPRTWLSRGGRRPVHHPTPCAVGGVASSSLVRGVGDCRMSTSRSRYRASSRRAVDVREGRIGRICSRLGGRTGSSNLCRRVECSRVPHPGVADAGLGQRCTSNTTTGIRIPRSNCRSRPLEISVKVKNR